MRLGSLLILSSAMLAISGIAKGSNITFTNSGQSLGSTAGFSAEAKLGDLDGDGDVDALVTSAFEAFSMQTWLNDGDGFFVLGQTFGTGHRDEFALADFDSDGDLDAFVSGGKIKEIWLNDSTGSFTLNSTITSPESIVSEVTAGDLDLDGDLDIFIGGGSVEVFINDGTADFSFLPQVDFVASNVSSLGDIDGDGDLDAFLGCPCQESEQLILNDGSGLFSASGQVFSNRVNTVAIANFDQNLGLDVLRARPNQLKFLSNNGSGILTEAPSSDIRVRPALEMAVGDLDGDGDTDAFTGGITYITFFENDGNGLFTLAQQNAIPGGGDAALADLDGDGDLDAFVAILNAGDQVWFNTSKSVPGTATLISPLESVATATPTFMWQDVENATRYRIVVYDRAIQQYVSRESHDASDICSGTSCSLTPEINLGYSANHFWRIRAWNADGWGDWTALQRFSRLPEVPSVPVLLSPLVATDEASPAFEWQTVEGASRYRLRVYDRVLQQNVHLENHEASAVCSETSCSFTPSIALSFSRNHKWSVRAWNIAGYGEWHPAHRFDRLPERPGIATLIAPLDSVSTDSPTFEWQAVEDTTRYRVVVYDRASREYVHRENHESSVICTASTCTLMPPLSLGYSDNHFWRVRAWNISGWGNWGAIQRFDRVATE